MNRPVDDARTGESLAAENSDDLAALPELISDIVETMRKGNLERLEVKRGNFHLTLRSFGKKNTASSANASHASSVEDDPGDEGSSDSKFHVVTSPMIGTFYAASAPGEPAFVQPGDQIEQGQVIGIVEAMKIMNEIVTDRSGEVLEILAENGVTVEYGSPLVRLAINP